MKSVNFSFVVSVVWALLLGGLAFVLDWSSKDLVWNLWLASFVTGYIYLLMCILLTKKHIVLRFMSALFMIPFFTVHFGMFHFVHAIFLDAIFPLHEGARVIQEMSLATVSDAGSLILNQYGLFALISLIQGVPQWWQDIRKSDKEPNLFKPYAKVIRMHLLIFVFIGLMALEASNAVFYIVVSFAFLPFEEIFKLKSRRALMLK